MKRSDLYLLLNNLVLLHVQRGERRKAEDKLAAAAWNSFMSTPIPKQK